MINGKVTFTAQWTAILVVPTYTVTTPTVANGNAADKFSPRDNCARGQIVTFLFRDRAK